MALRTRALAGWLCVVVTMGCTARDHHALEPTPTAQGTYLVLGMLRLVGGPMGVPERGLPGAVVFTNAGRATTVSVPANGLFSLWLPPGPYTVTGRSPLFEGGGGLCRPTTPVVMVNESGPPARVTITCVAR